MFQLFIFRIRFFNRFFRTKNDITHFRLHVLQNIGTMIAKLTVCLFEWCIL
jgi:hypothetical protein